jgi:DNA (cytosine-5)-methyltransferase 1
VDVNGEMIVDAFAGAGGWEALSGVDALGIELDESACAIREAAGLRTLRGDVAALDPLDFAPCEGLIASAPCQAFSSAGKGEGRDAIEVYREAITIMAEGREINRDALDVASSDERGHLVLEPLRWALALNPRWIALEQVPPVLPLWEAMAVVLRERGYSVATSILSSERYGVPQTRQRAILIASLDRVVSMPPPTHQRYIAPRRSKVANSATALFAAPEPERIVAPEDRHLLPWVSMAQALSWIEGPSPSPSPTVTAGGGATGGVEVFASKGARERAANAVRFVNNSRENATTRAADEPAPTITAGHDHEERRWVVQTNNFTAVARDADGQRSKAGSVPYERDVDDPAPTVTGRIDTWKLRAGTNANDCSRPLDSPAPTIRYGDRLNDVSWVPEGQARNSGPGAEREPRPIDAPSYTIRAAGSGSHPSGVEWVTERPSTTVNCDPRIAEPGRHEPGESGSQYGSETVRVSIGEAAALQSFPADWPWSAAGTKTAAFRGVGNAVPPLLALHVLLAVVGPELAASFQERLAALTDRKVAA